MLPPYQAVSPPKANTSAVVCGGALILGGWSLTETTGAAGAQCRLWDGGTGGQLLADVTLLAGQSTRDLIGGSGLRIANQLFYEAVSGQINASLWIVAGEELDAYLLTQGVRPVWSGTE